MAKSLEKNTEEIDLEKKSLLKSGSESSSSSEEIQGRFRNSRKRISLVEVVNVTFYYFTRYYVKVYYGALIFFNKNPSTPNLSTLIVFFKEILHVFIYNK